jgi:hypothetical protein
MTNPKQSQPDSRSVGIIADSLVLESIHNEAWQELAARCSDLNRISPVDFELREGALAAIGEATKRFAEAVGVEVYDPEERRGFFRGMQKNAYVVDGELVFLFDHLDMRLHIAVPKDSWRMVDNDNATETWC